MPRLSHGITPCLLILSHFRNVFAPEDVLPCGNSYLGAGRMLTRVTLFNHCLIISLSFSFGGFADGTKSGLAGIFAAVVCVKFGPNPQQNIIRSLASIRLA